MEDYQDRITIATPEGVELRLVLAGLGSRFTAGMVDLAIKLVVVLAIQGVAALSGVPALGIVAGIAFLVVYVGYDVLFEVLAAGRTPAKRWTGLRVLQDDGRPVGLAASLVRNVLRFVDGVPLGYLPGILCILVTKRHKRLGDLAAGTIVVRERGGEAAAAPAAFAPPTAVRGPGDVSGLTRDELAAVQGFLERRAALDPAARDRLAHRLAAGVRPRVVGPVGDLTDEALLEWVARSE